MSAIRSSWNYNFCLASLTMVSFKLRAVVLAICSTLMVGQASVSLLGDEIVIDNQGNSEISLGDFRCSSCPTQINSAMGILEQAQSGEVSAGELWQFFHSQGVDSLDQLTLFLDVDQLDGQAAFDLQSIELKIEDPRGKGELLTNVSLGNNTIIVPGFETSSFRPEAKLQISLGYDFMQRFTASSQEKIKLDFSSSNNDLASNVKFSIEGNDNSGFSSWHYWLLAGFVGFWVVVFFVLNRVTKKMADAGLNEGIPLPPSNTPTLNGGHPSDRALSA